MKEIKTGRYRMLKQDNENILLYIKFAPKRFAMSFNFLSKNPFDCIVYFELLFLGNHRFENTRLEFLKQAAINFLLIKR